METAIRGSADAERRQVTVLFCDLVGSTSLSERLDPEDLREVVGAYLKDASACIHGHGGYVAQYLGDGVVAYFGYPAAGEDDARRAVRAGLSLQESIGALSSQLQSRLGAALQIRVGIDTGTVAIGGIGGSDRRESLAIGDTPNIAARLQSIAQPGQTVISVRTWNLVAGWFDVEPLGPQKLKGLSTDLAAFVVNAERSSPGRARQVAPMVGRTPELELIHAAFRDVSAGRGRVVSIVSEPGIGKSRLVLAAKETLPQPHGLVELRCSPYALNTALHPVIEFLDRQFGFAAEDPPGARANKVRATLATSAALSPAAPVLFASLLSVPLPPDFSLGDMGPREQRKALLDAIVTWLLEDAARLPQVVVTEDLQWADPTTVELLGMIVERSASAALLNLFTFRPEYSPPWGGEATQRIALERLGAAETVELARATAGATELPAEVVDAIATKTDGVPLFVEELTKAVLESEAFGPGRFDGSAGGSLPSEIPSTLKSSLMARLDRLPPESRELAQIAAVIGRDFPLALLGAVANSDLATVALGIRGLEDAGLVLRADAVDRTAYSFKHVLIQQTAYQSMLRATRRQHHLEIARNLIERFAEDSAAQPEHVARHYREGGDSASSLEWFGRAGVAALERSAAREAVAHFREALALVPDAGALGTPTEAPLQVGLGGALVVVDGYVTPEVEVAFRRALAIGSSHGEGPDLLPAQHGLWLYALIGGRLEEANQLSERMLDTATHADANTRAEAEYASGLTSLFAGRIAEARALLESALATLDPSVPRVLFSEHKADATFPIFLAAARCLQGDTNASAALASQSLELADASAHAYTQATVLAWRGVVMQLLGHDGDALASGQRGVAVAEAGGLGFWHIASALVATSSLPAAERVGALPPVIEAYNGFGARLMETQFLLRLAAAHSELGDTSAALEALDRAASSARETGQAWLEPERLRMAAELAAPANPSSAEGLLQHAIDLAASHGSLLFELRAAIGLSRLLEARGDRDRAAETLRNVIAGTDSSVTASDLAEARASLNRLAANA